MATAWAPGEKLIQRLFRLGIKWFWDLWITGDVQIRTVVVPVLVCRRVALGLGLDVWVHLLTPSHPVFFLVTHLFARTCPSYSLSLIYQPWRGKRNLIHPTCFSYLWLPALCSPLLYHSQGKGSPNCSFCQFWSVSTQPLPGVLVLNNNSC